MKSLDLFIIMSYLIGNLLVSFLFFKNASTDKESYFLGGRSIPWWWAGVSIAATTFAADTPLAITGIIAKQGVGGNWIWLSWIIMHASIAVYFAIFWRRSEVVTDAQIISLRYSGPSAKALRLFKSGFYAFVFNCITLAWVIRAMVKILAPFLEDSPIAGYEAFILTIIVAIYSSSGGLKAVMFTDIFQLIIAMVGSYAMAYLAIDYVGGIGELSNRLVEFYGENHHYTSFTPRPESGDLWSVGGGILFFGYLVIQAFSNSPADGGGYIMQRLSSCESPEGAKKATFLFIFIQYILRLWPWVVVALCALIIFPIGQEALVLGGKFSYLATDREAAYPALMKLLLPSGLLGFVIIGMLAAFMSTVDTHLNWGSSYVVNDFLLTMKPDASEKEQVLVGRISVFVFAIVGIIFSFYVNSISKAWEWLSILGASFAFPTFLRWFWWRINPISEFLALGLGLVPAIYFYFGTNLSFPQQMLWVASLSFVGTLVGAFFFNPTDPEKLKLFVEKIQPTGLWGHYSDSKVCGTFWTKGIEYISIILFIVSTFFVGEGMMNQEFNSKFLFSLSLLITTGGYKFFYAPSKK